MRLINIIRLVVSCLIWISLIGCEVNSDIDQDSMEQISLALDWFPNANHAGLFLAIENGYFAEEGLEVSAYTPEDPASILQTVGTGADDFGINYQPDLLLARDKGVPVLSVAGIVQSPLNSVMTLHSSGLKRPRDLDGKKVGYPGIPLNEPMLDTMLKYDGVTKGLEQVELVNVGFNLGASLISGQVDACVGCFWTYESIAMKNQGFPVEIMKMEEWGVPPYYELILVTNEDMHERKGKTVQKFVNGMIRGYMEASRDPQAAVDSLMRAHPEIDPEIDRPGADLLAPLWKGDVPRVGWQSQVIWEQFSLWMQNNGLIDNMDISKAYSNSYVAQAPTVNPD